LSRVPLRNEVFEKLRDTMNTPGRHGVIKMELPGPIGIQMRTAKPTDPLRVIVDLSPVRNLAIDAASRLRRRATAIGSGGALDGPRPMSDT
jgi:hypothetical protein